jgi:phosphoenolpyruvate carboxylase
MTEYASRQLSENDHALGRDFRLLGWQLRRLVRRHGGEQLWDLLHDLRALAHRRTNGDGDAEQQMVDRIAHSSTEALAELTRAVGLFFDLANLAEDRHRVRVLHRRQRAGTKRETMAAAAKVMREAGLDTATIARQVESLRIEPVLTAHPTEAKRRSIRRALRRLRRDLVALDRPDILRPQRRAQLARMNRDLAALWYTDPVRARKPEVMEELRRTMFAVRTMWRVVPKLMGELRQAFPESARHLRQPHPTLSFGNWVGGDRDGNPFVTTPVTRRTLRKLRSAAIKLHRGQCRRVRERLTISDTSAGKPEALIAALEAARQRWPSLGPKLDRLHPDEWFVHWLTVIDTRLRYSKALPDEPTHDLAYRSANELIADVQLMADALEQTDHDELLGGALQRWRDRLGCFGLHLLRLDTRVNTDQVAQAVGEVLLQLDVPDDYAALPTDQRLALLREHEGASFSRLIDRSTLSAETGDLIKLLGMLQQLADRGGRELIGPVILSMTHSATDVLALRWLMRVAASCCGLGSAVPLPVAPLFETIDDLERADRVMDELLADQPYRHDVRALDDEQICMIGYSDSAKDGGFFSAHWALYRSQQQLSAIAQKHAVKLTQFHGRGGALGRGGGPAARAILSLPPESVDGRLRLTEQGEVIAERYDDPAIASRHLEQLFWATLTLGAQAAQGSCHPDQLRLAQAMAQASFDQYRKLIDDASFTDYMRQCTALPLIETLRIGSRPSRRSGAQRFEDLRAIPFTFAWNQVRIPLNAFYGLGGAFDALSETDQKILAELYRASPWFAAVVDNAELALARTDPAIARRYAGLSGDQSMAESIWTRLDDECKRAKAAVLAIKNEDDLLSQVDWLQRTLRIRTPYVDIVNLVQVELLTRQRDHGNDPQLNHALRRTVQAIAAGLRNTG